jgi:helicase MOV-10
MSETACPNLLASGVCDDARCPARHDVSSCELCNLVFASPADYAIHATTKQHLNKLQGETGAMLHCTVCQKYIPGMKNWVVHVAGARHAAVAAARGLRRDVVPEEPEYISGHTLCSTCNSHISDRYWPRHHLTPKHKAREQFISFRAALDEAEKDKHGVSVAGNFDFGIVEPAAAKSRLVIRPTIHNATPSSKVLLISITLASDKGSRTQSPYVIASAALFLQSR